MPTLPPASRKNRAKGNASTNAARVLAVMLGDEALFGDNAPKWKGAPTADDASCKHLRLIKRLRRFSLDFEGSAELAAKLQTCGPQNRCSSGGCPECGRAYQRWFVAKMLRFTDVA
jgi:hypothetical protein